MGLRKSTWLLLSLALLLVHIESVVDAEEQSADATPSETEKKSRKRRSKKSKKVKAQPFDVQMLYKDAGNPGELDISSEFSCVHVYSCPAQFDCLD